MLRGVVLTIELTFVCMVVGAVGGTILAVMRLSEQPRALDRSPGSTSGSSAAPRSTCRSSSGATSACCGRTFYAGLPFTGLVARLDVDAATLINNLFVVGVLALGLNEAAYAAELVRAGIISVDAGQTEAASSLGMSPTLIMRRIVLPQAMRVIIPTMGNETISMLKTTSLLAVLGGGVELFGRLQIIYSQTFQIIPLLVVACIWYLVITTVLTIGQHYLEAYFGRGFGAERGRGGREAGGAKGGEGAMADADSSISLVPARRRPLADRRAHGQGRAGLEVASASSTCSRASTSRSCRSRPTCCSGPRAAASRPCCAASTTSRRSTPAGSGWPASSWATASAATSCTR